MNINASIVKDAALNWFWGLDSTAGHGPQQSRTPATLRDTLLPELLRRELSVNETKD